MQPFITVLKAICFSFLTFALYQYSFSFGSGRNVFVFTVLLFLGLGFSLRFFQSRPRVAAITMVVVVLACWLAVRFLTFFDMATTIHLGLMLASMWLGYAVQPRQSGWRIGLGGGAILVALFYFLGYPQYVFSKQLKPLSEVYLSDSLVLEGAPDMVLSPAETDIKDQILVLDFWYRGCGSCFKGFGELQALKDHFSESEKVRIIAVNDVDGAEDLERGTSRIRKLGYDFEVMVDKNQWFRKKGVVKAYPTQLIVDAQGQVLFRIEGYNTDSRKQHLRWMKNTIRSLLSP